MVSSTTIFTPILILNELIVLYHFLIHNARHHLNYFSGGDWERPARPVRQEEGHRPIQNVKHFRGVWEFAQDASPAAARIPGKTGD